MYDHKHLFKIDAVRTMAYLKVGHVRTYFKSFQEDNQFLSGCKLLGPCSQKPNCFFQ